MAKSRSMNKRAKRVISSIDKQRQDNWRIECLLKRLAINTFTENNLDELLNLSTYSIAKELLNTPFVISMLEDRKHGAIPKLESKKHEINLEEARIEKVSSGRHPENKLNKDRPYMANKKPSGIHEVIPEGPWV